MTPEERQAILSAATPEQVAAAKARHDAWNELRRSFGVEKDGHRTCWGCIHAHFGPFPLRVCSVRMDEDDPPFIYGAPYDELVPGYDYGHLPGRTVADECNLYEHGLPKVVSDEEAQAAEAAWRARKATRLGQELLARFSDPKRDYSEFRRLLRGEEETYKPFYRALALMLAPDGVEPGASRGEAEAILRATHHYFVGALERDREEFNRLYDMFIDLYPPTETP